MVHGAEGNVLLYRQTAQHLPPDQPVYGLQSQGLNGSGELDTTIGAMAARYLEEIVSVQAQGPYYLAGYCLGGTIALEIAQQLRARGEAVGKVILLDTYNEGLVPASIASLAAPMHIAQNAWFHAANMLSVKAGERRKFLKEKIDIAANRIDIRVQALGLRSSAQKKQAYPHLSTEEGQ